MYNFQKPGKMDLNRLCYKRDSKQRSTPSVDTDSYLLVSVNMSPNIRYIGDVHHVVSDIRTYTDVRVQYRLGEIWNQKRKPEMKFACMRRKSFYFGPFHISTMAISCSSFSTTAMRSQLKCYSNFRFARQTAE